MDVVNAQQVQNPSCELRDFLQPLLIVICFQARIAEEAGACAVMALERVPADIRKEGGVARMVRAHLTYSDM
jgi:pyridoxal 5'-phosphate synthase pdxS subunit